MIQPDADGFFFDTFLDGDGNGRKLLFVEGEIDCTTAERFEVAVRSYVSAFGELRIDMTGVTFMDSSGLAVLVAASRLLRRRPEAIVVRGASDSVRRTFEITQLSRLVTFDPLR